MSGFGKLGLPAQTLNAYCDHCDATPEGAGRLCRRCDRKKKLGIAASIFIGVECAAAAAFLLLAPAKAGPVAQQQEEAAITLPSFAAAEGWTYYDTQDSAAGAAHHARLRGATGGMLELAASKTYGRVVTVTFPKMKTGCKANPCEVRAIFDETQPENFAYTDASDAHSTVLMLKDYDRFAQRLEAAHDLTLIASLGTHQDHILTFTVAGYRLARLDGQWRIELTALERPTARPYPG